MRLPLFTNVIVQWKIKKNYRLFDSAGSLGKISCKNKLYSCRAATNTWEIKSFKYPLNSTKYLRMKGITKCARCLLHSIHKTFLREIQELNAWRAFWVHALDTQCCEDASPSQSDLDQNLNICSVQIDKQILNTVQKVKGEGMSRCPEDMEQSWDFHRHRS